MPVKVTYTEDQKYGLPEQKKYPMPDKQHVISAIKFFNYVDPKYEKQLAKAILARIEEYGMSLDDIGVGEDNRFSKYIPDQHLAHHGIKGQKWGVRRYQNEDGTFTEAGKKRYFKENGELTRVANRHNAKVGKQMDKTFMKVAERDILPEMAKINKELMDKYKGKNIDGMVSLDGRTFIPKTKAGEQYMKEYNDRMRKTTIAAIKKNYSLIDSGEKIVNNIYDSMFSINVLPHGYNIEK